MRNEKNRFTEVATGQGKAQFKLIPKVTTNFQYIADVQNCLVLLRLHNFNRPDIQEIRYKPESITEELMEETAKYILNKENRFNSLSGNDVADEALAELRKKLRQDGKIPGGGVNTASEEKVTKKKSIFGKLLKK